MRSIAFLSRLTETMRHLRVTQETHHRDCIRARSRGGPIGSFHQFDSGWLTRR